MCFSNRFVFLPNQQQSEPAGLPLSTEILSTTKSIGTDTPVATDRARPVDPLGHNAGDDASFIAILALKRMPKRRNSDLESPQLGCNHRQPPQHPGLGPTPIQDAPVELDTVKTAVEMQCEESTMRNFNVQATQQPSGATAMTG